MKMNKIIRNQLYFISSFCHSFVYVINNYMNPHYSSPRHYVQPYQTANSPFYNPQKDQGSTYTSTNQVQKTANSAHFIPPPTQPTSKSYVIKSNFQVPKVNSNNSGYLKSNTQPTNFHSNFNNYNPVFAKTSEMTKSSFHQNNKAGESIQNFVQILDKPPSISTPPRRQPRYSEPAQFEISSFETKQDTKASFIPYIKTQLKQPEASQIHFYKKSVTTTPEVSKQQKQQKGRDWLKQSGRNKRVAKFGLDNFDIVKNLGKGKYGQVYLVKEKKSGFMCALKAIQKTVLKQQEIVDQFIRQVKIQMFLNHPNIIKMYGCFDDQKCIYVILQVAIGGQLYEQLKRSQPMAEVKVAGLMKQICTAVDELHSLKVIHRDIKPQNIVMHQNIIKLCDFGWSVHLDNKMRTTFCGTPLYVCPQILKGNQYDQKIDIWSLGIMMYEMLVGQNPFKISKEEELIKIIKEEISIPSYIFVSKEARDFLDKCLKKNPNDRVTIKQLANHDFLLKSNDKAEKKIAI